MPTEYQNATARPASLEEEIRTVIEEARMVLPGIQAFFGFQLIAVFNNRFQELTHTEQVFHLIALLLLAVSIALIMTPARVSSDRGERNGFTAFRRTCFSFSGMRHVSTNAQHHGRSFLAYSIDPE